MKMGAQIRTGKRLPDTGKRFRDRIWAYAQGTQLLALSEFPISIGKSFSGADLYPHFHFQITVEPPRLIFFLSWITTTTTTLASETGPSTSPSVQSDPAAWLDRSSVIDWDQVVCEQNPTGFVRSSGAERCRCTLKVKRREKNARK